MAGKGLRTKELGVFKQLIDIDGKTMLEWFLLGIKPNIKPDDTLIFIFLEEYVWEHFYTFLNDILDRIQLHTGFLMSVLKTMEAGPAKTVQAGLKEQSWRVDFGKPAVVVNSDQFIKFDLPEIDKEGGFATVYYNDNPKSSYVKIQDGSIVNIKEKELISNCASSGVYGFGTTTLLLSCIDLLIHRGIKYKGEYYVGPALQMLCAAGRKITPVKTKVKFDLGTVKGIEEFAEFRKDLK